MSAKQVMEVSYGGARAQSTLEYVVLVAIVAAAYVAMQTYARRSIQAHFKALDHTLRVDTEFTSGATP